MSTLLTKSDVYPLSDLSSGCEKSENAIQLVKVFKDKYIDVTYNQKTYTSKGTISSTKLEPGMFVLISYNSTNQGADIYEFMGYTDDPNKQDVVKYKTIQELKDKYKVASLPKLENVELDNSDIDFAMIVKDVKTEEVGGWFYLYEGKWSRGSGAESLSFTLIEEVK